MALPTGPQPPSVVPFPPDSVAPDPVAPDSVAPDLVAPDSVAPAPVALELEMPPASARQVARLLGLKGRRGTPRRVVWHDGPDFELAARGLAVATLVPPGRGRGRPPRWRAMTLRRWIGAPQLPRGEAAEAELLAEELPADLRPVAAFAGNWRGLGGDGVVAEVLLGRLVAGEREEPCCRVRLAGPADDVAAAARRLAGALPARAATTALAAEALALAGAVLPEPSAQVEMDEDAAEPTVGAAFARLFATLAATLVRLAPAVSPQDEEPVHQMRVAVRRLRSALRVFHRAVGGAALAEADGRLRALARLLAPARAWDVFLGTTGQALVAALPDSPEVARLLAKAEHRRRRIYAALQARLAEPDFRLLGVDLAVLAAQQPWNAPGEEAEARLARPVRAFARHVLSRRLHPLEAAGRDLAGRPAAELHALRLGIKRFRYAAEFFAPLFPGREARRMLRRLAEMQEALGRLQDGASNAALLAELKLGDGYAGGLVAGLTAAEAPRLRRDIVHAWRRLHRIAPFWRE